MIPLLLALACTGTLVVGDDLNSEIIDTHTTDDTGDGLDTGDTGDTDTGDTDTGDTDTGDDWVDIDEDGWPQEEDCNDLHPGVNPDAEEVPYNDLDDDCDASTPDDDLDEDGYLLDEDCDDLNADVSPEAEEVCGDGLDNDCDGTTDNLCDVTDCSERYSGDTYGVGWFFSPGINGSSGDYGVAQDGSWGDYAVYYYGCGDLVSATCTATGPGGTLGLTWEDTEIRDFVSNREMAPDLISVTMGDSFVCQVEVQGVVDGEVLTQRTTMDWSIYTP
jgi:hypothetical protein